MLPRSNAKGPPHLQGWTHCQTHVNGTRCLTQVNVTHCLTQVNVTSCLTQVNVTRCKSVKLTSLTSVPLCHGVVHSHTGPCRLVDAGCTVLSLNPSNFSWSFGCTIDISQLSSSAGLPTLDGRRHSFFQALVLLLAFFKLALKLKKNEIQTVVFARVLIGLFHLATYCVNVFYVLLLYTFVSVFWAYVMKISQIIGFGFISWNYK